MIYGKAVSYMQIKSPIQFSRYFNYSFMAHHNFTRKDIYAQLHSEPLHYVIFLSFSLHQSLSLIVAFILYFCCHILSAHYA